MGTLTGISTISRREWFELAVLIMRAIDTFMARLAFVGLLLRIRAGAV